MMAVIWLGILAAFALGAWEGYGAGWRYGRRALRHEVGDGGDMDDIIDGERRA